MPTSPKKKTAPKKGAAGRKPRSAGPKKTARKTVTVQTDAGEMEIVNPAMQINPPPTRSNKNLSESDLYDALFPDLNAKEVALARAKAQSVGANVFAGEFKAYKKDGQIIYQVAHDFLKNKAWENPEFSSYTGRAVYSNDTFEITENGEVRHAVKAFSAEKRGTLLGAWCVGKAKDGTNFPFLAEMEVYAPDKVEGTWWENNPAGAILKVAESVVLKKFAKVVGVYVEDELTKFLNSEKKTKGKSAPPDIANMSALNPE